MTIGPLSFSVAIRDSDQNFTREYAIEWLQEQLVAENDFFDLDTTEIYLNGQVVQRGKNFVDYVKPDGTEVRRPTIDPRQPKLNRSE